MYFKKIYKIGQVYYVPCFSREDFVYQCELKFMMTSILVFDFQFVIGFFIRKSAGHRYPTNFINVLI